MRELLLGDEAVGLGAIDAGISGSFAYPGTPATEIMEFVQARTANSDDIVARWSANEKVAYEEALGMSYVGKRSLLSMKHVGLNVAADPFMSSALTGANGGLVVAIADDPGMHSSQNEQDTRYYGHFAQIPIFEPSDQQEAYDATREAFDLSERFKVPVLVRMVTRLSHSRGVVETQPVANVPPKARASDWREWTLLPVNARRRYGRLLDLQKSFVDYAENSSFNELSLRGPKGIIATGIGYHYVREALGDDHGHSMLKITSYPVPVNLVRQLIDHCSEIFLIEEGFPFVERQLRGICGVPGKSIHGKFDGTLPRQGELSTELVGKALGLPMEETGPRPAPMPSRPPQLCSGCPHCDSYKAIVDAVGGDQDPYFFSDIGCYTLAALPPHNAVDTCVEMGASIGMAIGAAKAGAHPIVSTLGDSTLIHSGLSSLVEAAHEDVNMTVVVLDNATVGMTGGQEVYITGDDLIELIRGLGVPREHVVRIEPLAKHHEENVARIAAEINHRGLSVIVSNRACIQVKRRVAQQLKKQTVATT